MSDERLTDLIAAHAHLARAAELARKHGLRPLAGVIGEIAKFLYDIIYPPKPAGEHDAGDDKER